MAIDTSRFDEELLEADDVDEQTLSDEPFAGLDLRAARCFGSTPGQNWKDLADQAEDVGYAHIDKEQLEKSLAKDVEKSYIKIAQFKLENVDDSMSYSLYFDNNKALWKLEILNSPKAEMTIEERADFFKSEMFKKIAKKTYYRLLDAYKTFNKNVRPAFENGEMLLVDAVKLEAILDFFDRDYFLKNLLAGKYLGY